jgi:microcompartment protein CcmK/EutM
MLLAKVVGNVVATVKDPTLESRKLLVIQPVAPSGAAAGAALVALDSVGVGAGEEVMFVKGREAAFAFLPDTVLADATIVGKVDSITGAFASGNGARRAPSSPSEERGERASRSPQPRALGVGPQRVDRRGERALKK